MRTSLPASSQPKYEESLDTGAAATRGAAPGDMASRDAPDKQRSELRANWLKVVAMMI